MSSRLRQTQDWTPIRGQHSEPIDTLSPTTLEKPNVIGRASRALRHRGVDPVDCKAPDVSR
jgi:hypothetical protein